jgi:hypothetical protein
MKIDQNVGKSLFRHVGMGFRAAVEISVVKLDKLSLLNVRIRMK